MQSSPISDIVTDSPFVRVLRQVMGLPSPDELLGNTSVNQPATRHKMAEKNFLKAMPMAWEKYSASFDPEYEKRRTLWAQFRLTGACELSAPWFGNHPALEEED